MAGMHSDGKSATLTESGDIFGGPARLATMYFVAGATAGSIVIRDGGATGPVLLEVATPSDESAHGVEFYYTPIRCESNPYAVLTNVTSATFFYY